MILQSVIRAIYPAQCVSCEVQTEAEHGLCGTCWRDTQFINGVICDTCGAPLPGEDSHETLQCDDCMTIARPWDRGRSALVYAGIGRRLVLGLKHGDRLDLTYPAATWMVRAARDLIQDGTIFVPVPLHWTRLLKRKYNQAAVLAQDIALISGCAVCVDALLRPRPTKPLQGHSREERFSALDDAIKLNPKRVDKIAGRNVVLVDDVMTSGATLAAAAEGCRAGGAANVSIVTLARVVKDT